MQLCTVKSQQSLPLISTTKWLRNAQYPQNTTVKTTPGGQQPWLDDHGPLLSSVLCPRCCCRRPFPLPRFCLCVVPSTQAEAVCLEGFLALSFEVCV